MGAAADPLYYAEYKSAVWDLFELAPRDEVAPACQQFNPDFSPAFFKMASKPYTAMLLPRSSKKQSVIFQYPAELWHKPIWAWFLKNQA